jgi:hypothetical protein
MGDPVQDATSEMDWTQFLGKWSRERAASPLAGELALQKPGIPPATEKQLASAEQRLGIALPPSYRAFLSVSNGWGRTTRAIERIWSSDEIDWFRKRNRDWISAYTAPLKHAPPDETPDAEYYSYGSHSELFKAAHFAETLQISAIGDAAVYLLNPQVITKEGEWEAWFLANWLPGVRRYRSFAELMQAEYSQFAETEWEQPSGVLGAMPDEYLGRPGSSKRHVKKRTRPREPKVLGKPIRQWTVDE